MLWFIEARRINSKRWALEAIFKEGKGVLGFSKASPTLFVNENKMSYVQDSFSLQDGRMAHLHRPAQGWTVREDILLCKVSLLHPPSSLGLDGGGERLSCYDD